MVTSKVEKQMQNIQSFEYSYQYPSVCDMTIYVHKKVERKANPKNVNDRWVVYTETKNNMGEHYDSASGVTHRISDWDAQLMYEFAEQYNGMNHKWQNIKLFNVQRIAN